MSKISTAIKNVLWNFMGILLTAATLIGFAQVVARYVFGHPFTWAEITSTLLFVWMLQMAIPVMFYKKTYLAFTLLGENMKPKVQDILHIFIDIMCFIFSACVLFGSIQLISSTGFQRATPGAPAIPIATMYLSMVISMGASLIINFDHIRVDIKSFIKDRKGELEC